MRQIDLSEVRNLRDLKETVLAEFLGITGIAKRPTNLVYNGDYKALVAEMVSLREAYEQRLEEIEL